MNVNVNAIAPGMTMSDAGKALTPEESPFVQAAMARVVKQPRGQPQDLVGALLLLCSPAGDWITGQALNVDGGFLMRSEEHTSELQSLMRISYAVFCLQQKNTHRPPHT